MQQVQAAQLLGMDQPKVSALVNGQLSGFSSDRLLRCLAALGQNVEIVIRAESRRRRGVEARGRRSEVSRQ